MKRLKVCTTLTILLISVIIPLRTMQACGFYVWPGEYRFWLLQPDLTNQPDLTPFFFASTYLYKGNEYAMAETYPEQNIEEWFAQIKGSSSKEAIDTLLNFTDPQSFFKEERGTSESFL